MVKLVLALFAILLCSKAYAFDADNAAKTIRSDGSMTDTKNAISYVKARSQEGWVLTVGEPGASYTWTGDVQVNVPRNFTFKGASPTNRPTITTTGGIWFSYAPGKVLTVRDLIVAQNGASNNVSTYINGSGPEPGFRFTNILWTGGTNIIWIGPFNAHGDTTEEGPYGLVDHCEMNGSWSGFNMWANNMNGDQATAWRRPVDFGTGKSVYFEDNNFHAPQMYAASALVDPFYGGGYVFRHNTVVNRYLADHGADHDGNKKGSALKHEIMHNTISIDSSPGTAVPWFIFLRGGTGVIFDNHFVNNNPLTEVSRPILWGYFRSSASAGPSNSIFDRFYNALSTTIAAASDGASLPQSTINVASTDQIGSGTFNQAWTTINNIKVMTSNGVQTVSCTGKTSTSFTGCGGGTGRMTTGGAVTRASDHVGTHQPGSGPIVARLTAAVTLPAATLPIDHAVIFPSNPGAIKVGAQSVSCTGKTSMALTGCSGGTGTQAVGAYVSDIGQDPQHPTEPWGLMPIVQWSNTKTGNVLNYNAYSGDGFIEPNRDFYDYGASTKPTDTATWVDQYVEYTYPHPLRSATPTPQPQPPANLHVQSW